MAAYDVGNGVIVTATFTNPAGAVYDPASVFFTIVPPVAVKTTIQYGVAAPAGWPSVVKASTGVYQLTLPYTNLNSPGDYTWSADDGNNLVANEGVITIRPRKATH